VGIRKKLGLDAISGGQATHRLTYGETRVAQFVGARPRTCIKKEGTLTEIKKKVPKTIGEKRNDG